MGPSLPSPLRPLLGVLFGLSILFSSLFGNYIITLFLPLLLLNRHRTWRDYMDRAISFWMMVPIGFLELLFGVSFRVSGDVIDPDQPALIIMNHRTRIDWMFFWSALYQMNPWLITTNKISLKKQLKSLPGFGMAANQFVFLERKMETDKQSLENAIDYYKGIGANYQLLLFPEGTDKSAWTTLKSEEYAKKRGLRSLKYLLYPRTAGFFHLVSKMREEGYLSCIYDVTIGYPVRTVQSEIELILKGASPRSVHFHVRRIDASAVPHGELNLEQWLQQLWFEKEERLHAFYAPERPSKRQFPLEKDDAVFESRREDVLHRGVKISAFVFWLTVVSIWLFHLTFLPFVQVGLGYFFVVSLVLHYCYGGVDAFVFSRWRCSSSRAQLLV